MVRLKEIDLTNGILPPDPYYQYFIDLDDPNGDIISCSRSQGARHVDNCFNKKPKVFTFRSKKKGKI